jgi:hypothetical protein
MRYLVLIVLLISGCATCVPQIKDEVPKGEFFASMLITEGAFSGPITKKEGFVFYIEQPAQENVLGPFLNGYRYEKGELVEEFDQGSGAIEYIQKINQLNFVPFNYESELEKAVKEAEKDQEVVVLHGRDGAEWELKIATKNGMFKLREWNPGGEIEMLAPYNENFRKLNLIIKILAQYYGDYHIHM